MSHLPFFFRGVALYPYPISVAGHHSELSYPHPQGQQVGILYVLSSAVLIHDQVVFPFLALVCHSFISYSVARIRRCHAVFIMSSGLSELRTVTFKINKNKTEKVQMIETTIALSSLRESVCEKFPEFGVTAFILRWDDAQGALIESDSNIALYLTSHGRDLTVFIEIACKGFGQFTIKDALSYAGATGVSPIVDNQKFVSAGYHDDDDTIKPLLDDAFREIMARIPVFGPVDRMQNESTVREFITPILLAAARIAKDIRLVCEKTISGSKGNGPVDYVAEYKEFNVVITEAKKDNVDTGLGQNIAQLVSSREDYIHNVLGVKRKIEEIAPDISSVPSFGVVSTAANWIFTLLEGSTVYRTDVYAVSLLLSDPNVDGSILRSQLSMVIRQLVGMLETQKVAVDNNDTTSTKKGRFGVGQTFASSSIVSVKKAAVAEDG